MSRLKDAEEDDPLSGSWLGDLKLALVVGGAGAGRQWMAGCCPPALLGLGLSKLSKGLSTPIKRAEPLFKGLSPPSKRAEPT